MKCTNKAKALRSFFIAGFLSIFTIILLSGCTSVPISAEYGSLKLGSSYDVKPDIGVKAEPYSAGLCIITSDVFGDGELDLEDCESALLIDLNNKEAVYAKNVYERLYPASLTKIMTALIAIKYGQPDMVLTASENVRVDEAGAQLAGIDPGDSMTLSQALRILLLYSANDVAQLIAENIGGTIDEFVYMMNDEAIRLGATGTHFVNANGLTDSAHYTTAYDLYLIFNECVKYDEFNEIIQLQSYDAVYSDKKGREVSLSFKNTNGYINGSYDPPANVIVLGGKTGTTTAAGHCLILLSKDINGNPFVSVVLKSDTTDGLYKSMNSLLELENK